MLKYIETMKTEVVINSKSIEIIDQYGDLLSISSDGVIYIQLDDDVENTQSVLIDKEAMKLLADKIYEMLGES